MIRAGYRTVNNSFNPRTPGGVRHKQAKPISARKSFNPRTPGGVRPNLPPLGGSFQTVSIHAPRVGCDLNEEIIFKAVEVSIHAPRVGCDKRRGSESKRRNVSIHAPRVGCDLYVVIPQNVPRGFNPRTPGGVRRNTTLGRSPFAQFQSTHPGWGATRSASKT